MKSDAELSFAEDPDVRLFTARLEGRPVGGSVAIRTGGVAGRCGRHLAHGPMPWRRNGGDVGGGSSGSRLRLRHDRSASARQRWR